MLFGTLKSHVYNYSTKERPHVYEKYAQVTFMDIMFEHSRIKSFISFVTVEVCVVSHVPARHECVCVYTHAHTHISMYRYAGRGPAVVG